MVLCGLRGLCGSVVSAWLNKYELIGLFYKEFRRERMSNTAKDVRRLSAEGYCCSQIMVQLGLEAKQDENPELLDAVAGLCGGLYAGLCCGILTGAACLLSMMDKENARTQMIPQLVAWFNTTYEPLYGGVECSEILADDPANRYERCPRMMEETIEKCRELLAEFGHEI
jgi:hypothetical protein